MYLTLSRPFNIEEYSCDPFGICFQRTPQCIKRTHSFNCISYMPYSDVVNREFQARRRGGSRGSNEPPLKINNGGIK